MAIIHSLNLNEGGGIIPQNDRSQPEDAASIIIGIGGTGVNTLKIIKKKVFSQLIPSNPGEAVPRYDMIRFLAIDTDVTAVDDPQTVSDLQKDAGEFLGIKPKNLAALLDPQSPTGRTALRKRPELNNWMSVDKIQPLLADNGAGGIRQMGRFMLFMNIQRVYEAISNAINDAMKGLQAGGRVNIHILAGLSGGTGSGAFIDVCYLVRKVLEHNGWDGKIFGYFFLPDVVIAKPQVRGNALKEQINRRNGYAAFRELDYLMGLDLADDEFRQQYGGTIGEVRTQKPPVDLAHLISATDTEGNIPVKGFEYSLNVVADYIMAYLAHVELDGAKVGEDGGLTMEGHLANIVAGISEINIRSGANYRYTILGASNAEVPFSQIATYLAQKYYEKVDSIGGSVPDDKAVDRFAKNVGLGGIDELYSALTRGTPDAGALWQRLNVVERKDVLYTPIDASNQHAQTLLMPATEWVAAYEGKVQSNFNGMDSALPSFERPNLGQNNSCISAVHSELLSISRNSDGDGGSKYAARLLSRTGRDLGSVVEGLLEENNRRLKQERAQDDSIAHELVRARDAFLNPGGVRKSMIFWAIASLVSLIIAFTTLFIPDLSASVLGMEFFTVDATAVRWVVFLVFFVISVVLAVLAWLRWRRLNRNLWESYLDALVRSYSHEAILYTMERTGRLLLDLKHQLQDLYTRFYAKLDRLCDNLSDTFAQNAAFLNDPTRVAAANPYTWRVVELSDVRETLDTALRDLDAKTASEQLMDWLLQLENQDEWLSESDFRVGRVVNAFMQERFREQLDATIETYIRSKYPGLSDQQIQDRVEADFLRPADSKAAPMFWMIPSYSADGNTTYDSNIITIPQSSALITQAGESFQEKLHNSTGRGYTLRRADIGDRVFALRFNSGLPLFAYQGVTLMKGNYEANLNAGLVGMHLYESNCALEQKPEKTAEDLRILEESAWGSFLPSPIPFSQTHIDGEAPTENEARMVSLFERAKALGVIAKDPVDNYWVIYNNRWNGVVAPHAREDFVVDGNFSHDAVSSMLAEAERLLDGWVSAASCEKKVLLKNLQIVTGYEDEVILDTFMRAPKLVRLVGENLRRRAALETMIAELKALADTEITGRALLQSFVDCLVTSTIEQKVGKIVYTMLEYGIEEEKRLDIQPESLSPQFQIYKAYVGFMALDEQVREELHHKAKKVLDKLSEGDDATAVTLRRRFKNAQRDIVGKSKLMPQTERETILSFYSAYQELLEDFCQQFDSYIPFGRL